MSRGNPNFAEYGFKKGDGRGGRPKGATNKTTRELKEAILLAAEKSKHSKGGGLVGYLTYLANSRPETYAVLLGRLLPLQAKIESDGNVQHTIVRPKPEDQMTKQELRDYYQRLMQIPCSDKPLLVIEHDPN